MRRPSAVCCARIPGMSAKYGPSPAIAARSRDVRIFTIGQRHSLCLARERPFGPAIGHPRSGDGTMGPGQPLTAFPKAISSCLPMSRFSLVRVRRRF